MTSELHDPADGAPSAGSERDLVDLLREVLPYIEDAAVTWDEGRDEAGNREWMAGAARLADRIRRQIDGSGAGR